MIAEVLGSLLLAVRPGALGVELLLAATVAALAISVTAVLRARRVPVAAAQPARRAGFDAFRTLLRATEPDAPGHRRARAPGAA